MSSQDRMHEAAAATEAERLRAQLKAWMLDAAIGWRWATRLGIIATGLLAAVILCAYAAETATRERDQVTALAEDLVRIGNAQVKVSEECLGELQAFKPVGAGETLTFDSNIGPIKFKLDATHRWFRPAGVEVRLFTRAISP